MLARANAKEWATARKNTKALSVDGKGVFNAALGKPATTSSAHVAKGVTYDGDRAVNGEKHGWDNRWVSDPEEDEMPWIEVDLQVVLSAVHIAFV